MITWNEAKRVANRKKHGVDFAAAERFDFETALIDIDDREEYGETRERAIGFVGYDLFVLVFTRRTTIDGEETIHAISFRKATKAEAIYYAGS